MTFWRVPLHHAPFRRTFTQLSTALPRAASPTQPFRRQQRPDGRHFLILHLSSDRLTPLLTRCAAIATMGIKQLFQIIKDEAPEAIKEGDIKNQFGRKVAIVSV